MKDAKLRVEIDRDAPITLLPFTDFFKGFEDIKAVRSLFGRKTAQVLKEPQGGVLLGEVRLHERKRRGWAPANQRAPPEEKRDEDSLSGRGPRTLPRQAVHGREEALPG